MVNSESFADRRQVAKRNIARYLKGSDEAAKRCSTPFSMTISCVVQNHGLSDKLFGRVDQQRRQMPLLSSQTAVATTGDFEQ